MIIVIIIRIIVLIPDDRRLSWGKNMCSSPPALPFTSTNWLLKEVSTLSCGLEGIPEIICRQSEISCFLKWKEFWIF